MMVDLDRRGEVPLVMDPSAISSSRACVGKESAVPVWRGYWWSRVSERGSACWPRR